MGESNAVSNRQRFVNRDMALASAALLQSNIFSPPPPPPREQEQQDQASSSSDSSSSSSSSSSGSVVPVTYHVMYMTGWSPHVSQPQAAPRGSATVSLEELAAVLESKKEQERPVVQDSLAGSGNTSGPPPQAK